MLIIYVLGCSLQNLVYHTNNIQFLIIIETVKSTWTKTKIPDSLFAICFQCATSYSKSGKYTIKKKKNIKHSRLNLTKLVWIASCCLNIPLHTIIYITHMHALGSTWNSENFNMKIKHLPSSAVCTLAHKCTARRKSMTDVRTTFNTASCVSCSRCWLTPEPKCSNLVQLASYPSYLHHIKYIIIMANYLHQNKS